MRLCLALLTLALLAVWVGSCGPLESNPNSTVNVQASDTPAPDVAGRTSTDEQALLLDDEPPLLLDDEPLLLLDDAGDEDPPGEPGADNSRCFVCHVNYMQETIAVTHASMDIGCAHCHGASDAHIADESWASGGNGTAPEIMYPRDKINPACMTCHPKAKIDMPHHTPVFATGDEMKVCTDCHGDHRLPQRRCKWK